MEKHRCKLCARTFSNGRALGGHMKGHLANHPLPPKTATHHHQLSNRAHSASSSSSSSGEEEQEKSRELGYGLRENPRKSLRFADPEFSFAGDSGSVVQDRESETESRNPTRRRSKRKPKVGTAADNATADEIKKPKLSSSPGLIDSPPAEPEPVSSVSDTSPEEDVAICLMLLSRDAWKRNNVGQESEDVELSNKKSESSKKKKKINAKHRCGSCNLDEHKRVCPETKKTGKFPPAAAAATGNDSKRFECPFCYRVFGSGQALGGHKRSHLLASSSSSNNTAAAAAGNSSKFDKNLIDLNLPAPLEDDEFSVVSDA